MKNGLKSNFDITWGIPAASALSAAAHDSTIIDMSLYMTAAFSCDVGTAGTGSTLAGKLQWSLDGSTNWTDDDGSSGNSAAVSLAANGTGAKTLYVIQPLARYYKAVWTVGVNTSVAAAMEIAGPKLLVDPT